MADSILAKILAYIWSLFCFDGQSAYAKSELPVVAPQGNPRAEALTDSDSYKIEGHYEKEQFLRHPSIGSKRKGRQKEVNSETHSKRYSTIFSLGSSMQYLSSFARHHRAGSTTVPVVIVTPSSPTRAVAELLPPSSSSTLEVTDATLEPSLHLTQSTSLFEDTGEVSLTSVKQVPGPIPPDVESDISAIEFDSWMIPAPQEAIANEPSFFLSESLQKITFKPIRCASHALSAVSDTLYDVPAVETLGDGIMPSYFTSTPPPKRSRSTGTKLRDIENNHVEALELPTHDVFYQYVDHLIPYPDVFDLDMYYDTTIPLRKKLKKHYSRDCTFESTYSLQSDDLIDPPLSEKLPLDDCKEKYGMATSSVTVVSSPVEHKHDFGSCCDNMSQSPSLLKDNNSSPSLSKSQEQPPHNSVNPRYINKPLNESTNTSFKTSGTTSPSSTVYSIDKSPLTRVKSQRQIHSLPASAHDQRSRSNYYCPQRSRTSSDSESDAGSMDALRARLREACEISNSISTHTDEMELWEPVSF